MLLTLTLLTLPKLRSCGQDPRLLLNLSHLPLSSNPIEITYSHFNPPSSSSSSPSSPSTTSFSSSPSSSSSQPSPTPPTSIGRGINGGFPCAACSVLLGMAEQLADINNNSSVYSALDTFCSYLPAELGNQCSILVHVFGPDIREFLDNGSSPDQICYQIGVCWDEKGKGICHLFPLKSGVVVVKERDYLTPLLQGMGGMGGMGTYPWVCNIPGLWQLCQALDRAFNRLEPGLDVDGDGHSPAEELRGSLWRGRDCNDGNPDVHPGVRPWAGDILSDTNCNGIQGYNASSGLGWEEELCGGSGARGLVYLGDSVGGHFHVPPQWFQPLEIDAEMFTNISQVIAAEADWPDLGFATGYRNSTMPGIISGRTDSLYLRLRERNRCNHRDYHNLARNGADSSSTLAYMAALARSSRDLPALVFYSLIGNDVCRMVPGNMTSVEDFRKNVLQALDYLESKLAPGSHVVLVGLIDAGFLYREMGRRYHPLGEYRKDVKYKDVYSWFTCMEIGPCAGWMTADKRLRRATSKRARQLTTVLRQVAAEGRYSKFDLAFLDNPFTAVLQEWVGHGGEVHQLVEPVDSLHPTQAAQALIADQVWRSLEENFPHFLGPINPNNLRIERLFGDQGGH